MSLDLNSDLICITGIGMVSSLGFDVSNSCAAARAGITRASELDYFRFKSSEDGNIIGAFGHQIPNATLGFEGDVRLTILAKYGLDDLLSKFPITDLDQNQMSLILALPDSSRVLKGMELIADDEIRQSRLDEIDSVNESKGASSDGSSVCRQVISQLSLSIQEEKCFTLNQGHCGFVKATKLAVKEIYEGRSRYCIIGGVDSLLGYETLQWLLDTERLRTDGIEAGIQPGEAGAFMMLERYEMAKSRGAKIVGVLRGISEDKEEASLFSGEPTRGRGLANVIQTVFASLGKEVSTPFWIVTDQNGEIYRAYEWGCMLTQIINKIPELKTCTPWYPAASFGDTGVASGFVGACMAMTAFRRGYNPSNTVIILSSSDEIERASMLIQFKIH